VKVDEGLEGMKLEFGSSLSRLKLSENLIIRDNIWYENICEIIGETGDVEVLSCLIDNNKIDFCQIGFLSAKNSHLSMLEFLGRGCSGKGQEAIYDTFISCSYYAKFYDEKILECLTLIIDTDIPTHMCQTLINNSIRSNHISLHRFAFKLSNLNYLVALRGVGSKIGSQVIEENREYICEHYDMSMSQLSNYLIN
jgi:hypothetical protein